MSFAPLAPVTVTAPLTRRGRLSAAFAPRFILLWCTGLLWVVPAFWDATFLYALAIWDAVLLVAWAGDLLRLTKPQKLLVSREWPSALAISVPSHVGVEVHNTGAADLECLLVDEVPAQLRSHPPMLTLRVAAGAAETAEYDVLPTERGDIAVARLYVRYRSRLGMAERWAIADLRQTVRVYPNFEKARGTSIYLTRSRQIELEKRLLRRRGQGKEFESLREYREGDEFRDICWTATARRAKLVTRIHQIERSQPVWIVLDSGRLMRTSSAGLAKLDHCVDAALGVAGLAMYSGDRVGLLAYGRRIKQRIGLGTGPAHLRELVEQLAQVRAEAAEADHVRAASTLLTLQKRRSLIIWLTDLAETAMTPEVIQAAGETLSRHLLLFVVMGDAALEQTAAARAEGVESMYRAAAAQELVYRRALLLGKLRERGALAMQVMPGRLLPTLLNQYLYVKERNLI